MASKAPDWPSLAASARKSEHPQERALDLQHDASAILRHLEVSKGSRVPKPVIDHVKNVQEFLVDLLKNPPGRSWWQGHEALHAEIKALRQSMEERLHSLEIAAKGPSFPNVRSWANIAAQGGAPPLSSRSGSTSTGVAPSELMEEAQIIVKLGDPEGVTRFRRMLPKDILAKAEKARIQVCQADISPPLAAAKFVAARQLRSGDLSLNLRSAAEAEAARQHPSWAHKLWKDAAIRHPTWGVVVHGVQVKSIDLTRPEGASKALLTDNTHRWGDDAEISHVSWLTAPPQGPKGQKSSAIVVEFTSPVPANKAIEYGVVWDSQILTAVKYDRTLRIRQCYNCQQYGHIGSICPNQAVCAYCAEHHQTRECPRRKAGRVEEPKCVSCGGTHCAWSRTCSAYEREVQRITTRLAERPPGRYHPVSPRFRAASPSLRTASTSTTRDSVSGGSGPGDTAAPSAQRTDCNMTDTRDTEMTDPTPAEAHAAAKAASEGRRASRRHGDKEVTTSVAPTEPQARPVLEFRASQPFNCEVGQWPARRKATARTTRAQSASETAKTASVQSERVQRILRSESEYDFEYRAPAASQGPRPARPKPSRRATRASTRTNGNDPDSDLHASIWASKVLFQPPEQDPASSSSVLSEPPSSSAPSIMTRSRKRRADSARSDPLSRHVRPRHETGETPEIFKQ